MKQSKKLLSWILVLSMIISLLPAMTFTANAADSVVTFDAAADRAETGADAGAWTLTKDGVTLTVSRGIGGNGSQYRVYKNETLAVSAAEGTVTKIVLTCTAQDAAQYGPGSVTTEQGSYDYDGYVGTWTGSDASVLFTASNNQVRCTSIEVTVSTDGEGGGTEPEGTDITILYTNDVHTYIDQGIRYSHIAALKDSYVAAGAPVLLMDAGDHIQGTAFGSMDNGETIVKLMNASGYDIATLGNHEFDYGMARALNLWNESNFPYVSANFIDLRTDKLVLDAYKVFELGGKKVAVVGLTTPESFTKSTPAYFQDEDGNYIYDIAGGTDGSGLYAAAQAAIDAARAEADYVIVLGHLGVDPASKPWTSQELIANTTGIDAFVDGHSHSVVPCREVLNKNGEKVILTQTGSYFGAIGKMTIKADGTITTELVKNVTEQNETVKGLEEAWITSVNDELGQVIGAATVTFDNYENGVRLVRKQETNTGDFAADALYYLFDNMGLDVDVAVMNGGGVRNQAVTGELSYLSCKSIHTFGNVACLQTITGQQLLDALEWGAKDANPEGTKESGGFLQISGATYEIHTYIPSTVQKDDKGVWVGGPTGEYRVKNVMVGGEPLDLNATYNLAGYNYTLRDLGDGFAMFDGAVNVLDYVMQDYMVLANYVQSFPVDETTGLSTITAENSPYGDVHGAGRITLVNEAPAEEEKNITILYTNDVHTYIDNEGLRYSNVAQLKEDLAAAGTPVLLVDAGDHIQGTAYGSMDNGETIIRLMNASGYDLATLGNHEFDYGMARCLNLWNESEFPYVSANFYSLENEALVLDAYKVFELGGKKVAFVGLTTPESFTKSTPAYFQNEEGEYIYDIFGGEDGKGLYEAAQTAIDAARAEADYVIVLGHLGDDPASQPWTSEELIANTTGIDAFIDGHSHSTVPHREVLDKDGKTVVLTQTGSYLASVGVMTIDAEGNIGTELCTAYEGKDNDVAAIEEAWITSVNDELGQVIGAATVTFDNYDENGKRLVRTYETNTGDFAADALYYLFDNMGLDVDIAVMNGGGVRNKAVTGELSYLSCKSIHTFGNVACLQTVTGQQILDALEFGARFAPDAECGGFLQVSSNVSYEIHSYIPNTIKTDDKSVWQAGPEKYRVQNVMINGEPLDLEAEYNLAGYNYTLRDLGDGFAMFDGAVNVLDYVMQDYMVLANYVQSFPVDETTGLPTITAENSPYGDVRGEGRIKLVTSAADVFVDVKPTSWYHDDVAFVAENGIMTGTSATTFSPKATLTRAEVATILYRMSGETVEEGDTFTDVKAGSWYAEAVTWAAGNGIVNGIGGGKFGPKLEITRQDLAVMLYRYASYKGYNVDRGADLTVFPDNGTVKSYAKDAMAWAVAAGIINGIAGNLEPKATASRAEMAAMIHRFMDPKTVEVEFLATSDIHGQVFATDYTADASLSGKHYQSLLNVATYVKQERAEHENTFLVDCGDLVQGTPLTYYYAFYKPEVDDPIMKALRMMDYDMFVPGNHEFNYGIEILQRQLGYLTSEATETEDSVAVGCANYLAAETNNDETRDWATWNGYKPYQVYNYDGVRVAVMGIGNPNIPKWDVPANWEGIYFAGVVETYKHYEAEMLEAADVIVLASHSGIDSDPGSDFIRELVSTTNSIDLVFTGHEHRSGISKINNADGEPVSVYSLSTKAAYVGKTVMNYNVVTGEFTLDAQYVPMTQSKKALYEQDADLLAALQPYETETWNSYMLKAIGTAAGNFTSSNLGGAPSAFVDLVNKVQIWGAYDRTGLNTPEDTSDDAPAMLSITAPLTSGNAANLIPEGDIVLGDMFKLYRYENWFYQITMSAKEVDCWLEYSASKVSVRNGSVSISGGLTYYDVIYGEGFSYVIDPSQPAGERVTISYNGEPVAEDFTFTVVVNNYRYNGGGNYIQWLNDHGCPFTPNDESRIVYSTQYDMIQGEDKGQARNLLADYITEQGTIYPTIDSTWSILGAN